MGPIFPVLRTENSHAYISYIWWSQNTDFNSNTKLNYFPSMWNIWKGVTMHEIILNILGLNQIIFYDQIKWKSYFALIFWQLCRYSMHIYDGIY